MSCRDGWRPGHLGNDFVEVHVEVDVTELAAEVFKLIVAKLKQLPIVMAADDCRD